MFPVIPIKNDSNAVIPRSNDRRSVKAPYSDSSADVVRKNNSDSLYEIVDGTTEARMSSLPRHHLNTTIEELSDHPEPLASSSPKNRNYKPKSTLESIEDSSYITGLSETTANTNSLTILTINFKGITNKTTELYNTISSSLPPVIIGT